MVNNQSLRSTLVPHGHHSLALLARLARLWRRQILKPLSRTCGTALISTSCSRFSKKCPVISQKVAQKLLFVTKVTQKLLEKQKVVLV